MSETPSPNGANGKGSGGRFALGNPGGPGNPFAKRVAKLRAALFKAITPADFEDVAATLLRQAKTGDVPAIRELFQRLLGPPESVDLMERLDALEAKIEQLAANKDGSWRN